MSEYTTLTGMVLSASPIGDFDKRLVILTKERGRITAFARGARRPHSALLAASNPFCFGTFEVYSGRDSYTLGKADIQNYFREIVTDPEVTALGFYFLEIANYYTRENVEEGQMLLLVYQSLRALLSNSFDNRLVRRIFEMKAMVINGEYPVLSEGDPYLQSTIYTMQYIASIGIKRLFSFKVTDDVLEQMGEIIDDFMKKHLDRSFHSLEMFDTFYK